MGRRDCERMGRAGPFSSVARHAGRSDRFGADLLALLLDMSAGVTGLGADLLALLLDLPAGVTGLGTDFLALLLDLPAGVT